MSVLNSQNQSANAATMPANGLNEVGQFRPNGRNRFDINYLNFFTPRFGELTPFLNFQTTEQDSIKFASRHEIRAYTFGAPLMSGIKMAKDTFAVPYNAIMPRNWDLFYKTPKFGDDIPNNQSCCAPSGDFATKCTTWIGKINDALNSYHRSPTPELALNILRHVVILESIFSAGSLPSLLGYHTNGLVTIRDKNSDITGFDTIYKDFAESMIITYSPSGFYQKYLTESSSASDWRLFFNWLRHNPSAEVDEVDFSTSAASGPFIANSFDLSSSFTAAFNYSSLVAYQLVCAQFYTNDNIDEIYSSDLFLSLAEKVAEDTLGAVSLPFPSFTYNGTYRRSDVFSWAVLSEMIDNLAVGVSIYNNALDYLSYLFVFRNAPKFGDYFVGARKNPLALGDTSAPVRNSKVSAIDTTKSILMQRFLNAVNKVGAQIQEYERQLLGGNLPPDVRLPKMISHEVDNVQGDEIEQTSSGDDLGKVVQNTRSYGGKFAFETSFSCPAIVIGICYFDASRVYCRSLDRVMLQEDRYDMFNPYLQTIGDQPLYLCELRNSAISSNNFGYQLRNAEFKQRYNVCSGGFVDNLPSWAFIADNDISSALEARNIDSDYIRCEPSEFDRFYSSLTGFALDTYFHFIVKFDNSIIASRSMLRTPSIL